MVRSSRAASLGAIITLTALSCIPDRRDLEGPDAAASTSGATPETPPKSPPVDTDAGGTDASSVKPEAGIACPPAITTFSNSVLDSQLGTYKPPKARNTAACTASDITNLANNVAAPAAFNDLKTGLSAPCVSCLFSINTDPMWSVFVAVPASGATGGFANYAACIHTLTSATCGAAYHYNETCYENACSQCAEADSTACAKAALAGACKSTSAKFSTDCPPSTLTTVSTACGSTSVANAKYMCGPP